MTDEQLAREVAVKVMGWELEGPNPSGAPYYNPQDDRLEWLDTTWPDAGRVIEKMRERGWYLAFACESSGRCLAVFGPDTQKIVVAGNIVETDAAPRAVFLAALKAVGVQND